MSSIHALQHVPFFQELDSTALDNILQSANQQQIPNGTFLFRQGEEAMSFYVILQGRVRLTHLTEEGQQMILGIIGDNEGVGIIAAIPGAEYPLTAQTIQPSNVLAWNRPVLMHLMEQYPRIALRTLRMIAGRFVDLQNRYQELVNDRVERRIARALLRLVPQTGQEHAEGILIDVPLSRQDIAEMVGTTLYTVSRTLSRWEQAGYIETGRERVVIRSLDHLVTIADDLTISHPDDPKKSFHCLR